LGEVHIFALDAVALAAGAVVLLASSYLAVLTLLSGRVRAPRTVGGGLSFAIVVPAHNEESVIARTIASLQRIDWPADQFAVVVCADNCTDSTAAIVRESGVTLLERTDTERRGKGHALEYAFAWTLRNVGPDAIVVVDADSEVSPNLLRAFAARFGAGERAVQCHYGVLNPGESWRTRLMTIALSCFHVVRSRARERLGVSAGFRGNGWGVDAGVLAAVPFRAYTLAEDVEYGIDLALLAGIRVAYVDEAHVLGEMTSSSSAAKTQRRRWEGGRLLLVRARLASLVRAAITGPNAVCLDLALDLLLPPLSYVALGIGVVSVLGLLPLVDPSVSLAMRWIGFAAAVVLAVHVLQGWRLSGVGLRGALDLARVPFFIAWKIMAIVADHAPRDWVRTERKRP